MIMISLGEYLSVSFVQQLIRTILKSFAKESNTKPSGGGTDCTNAREFIFPNFLLPTATAHFFQRLNIIVFFLRNCLSNSFTVSANDFSKSSELDLANNRGPGALSSICLLYTSDAADDLLC